VLSEPVTSSVADGHDEPKPGRRAWLRAHWPASTRKRVAAVIAILAIVVATVVASASLLERLRNPQLDLLGYLSLFLACWIGAGGALVPIPGVRPISWVMIVQQGAALDPVPVTLISAFAMVLGQTSYFLATRAAEARASRVSSEGADVASEPAVEPLDTADADEPQKGRIGRLTARARHAVEHQIHRHGFVTVFVVSALPTPLTTLTTTAAASSGMGYARYFIAAAGGFLVLCAVLAFSGDQLFGGFFRNLLR
jgi:uncharacterized membrane protein YdjX (TVP38/TMEM64 family)